MPRAADGGKQDTTGCLIDLLTTPFFLFPSSPSLPTLQDRIKEVSRPPLPSTFHSRGKLSSFTSTIETQLTASRSRRCY